MAPVTIRAASFCIFSSLFTSDRVQLSHITSAYSRTERIKEKYIVWSDFLSSLNLDLRIIKVKRIAFRNKEHTKSRKSETRFDRVSSYATL